MPEQYLSTDATAGEPVQATPASLDLGAVYRDRVGKGVGQVLRPENWPAIGGAVGGAVGGVGGTVLGTPVGGVPGAIGGAALGGGTGEALRQLVQFFTGGGDAPDTAMGRAVAIGKEGGTQGALEAAGGALVKGAGAAGTALYRGYLKPALNAVDLPKAREIVATALREALPISAGGEQRARALIAELSKQVNGLLTTASGARIDLRDVANKVRSFAQAKYNRPGVPPSDFQAAMKVADEIDQHPSLARGAGRVVAVNPEDANKIKQGIDTAIGDRAFGVERGAADEARKVGRHEMRVSIEGAAPGVGELNARQSQLIEALGAIQRATGREENRNALMGVPALISGTLGTGVSARSGIGTGLVTALVSRGLLSPEVASRVAILADRFGRVPGTLPADAVRLAVAVAESESAGQQRPEP